MSKRNWAMTMAVAFSLGFVSALISAPSERFDHVVRNDFFAGFAGNAGALARAMLASEQVLAANPKHAEALVWHGSGLYFQSGVSFQQGDAKKGMELYLRAMDEMDRAVKLEPDNVGVRIPRGAALLEATRFQNAGDRVLGEIRSAVADFEHVYQLQKDQLDQLGEHPLGQLLLGLGDGYSRLGEKEKARFYFDTMAKMLPGTAYAERADTWKRNGKLTPAEGRCVGCHTAK